jgi:hypothetical protein
LPSRLARGLRNVGAGNLGLPLRLPLSPGYRVVDWHQIFCVLVVNGLIVYPSY